MAPIRIALLLKRIEEEEGEAQKFVGFIRIAMTVGASAAPVCVSFEGHAFPSVLLRRQAVASTASATGATTAETFQNVKELFTTKSPPPPQLPKETMTAAYC